VVGPCSICLSETHSWQECPQNPQFHQFSADAKKTARELLTDVGLTKERVLEARRLLAGD